MPMICMFLRCFIKYLSFDCSQIKEKTGHEACPGKGDAPLGSGDKKGNVGITSNHHLSGFGQRKSADGDSANAGLFFFWSTGCIACGWLSPMLGCIMCSRPFLTVYMIAGIDLGIMRHCAPTFRGRFA